MTLQVHDCTETAFYWLSTFNGHTSRLRSPSHFIFFILKSAREAFPFNLTQMSSRIALITSCSSSVSFLQFFLLPRSSANFYARHAPPSLLSNLLPPYLPSLLPFLPLQYHPISRSAIFLPSIAVSCFRASPSIYPLSLSAFISYFALTGPFPSFPYLPYPFSLRF